MSLTARAQIHGYDLNALVCSPSRVGEGDHVIYSAGDEKVIRVFDAPQNVLDGLHRLCVDPSGRAIAASGAGNLR